MDRRPMAPGAPAVRQSQHLLAAAQGLGRDRRAAHALAGLCGPAQGPTRTLRGRMRGRWPRGPRDEREPKAGTTKRGKGTMWMVPADGAGPPPWTPPPGLLPAKDARLEQTVSAVGRPGTPRRPRKRPQRRIADRGDDRNALRAVGRAGRGAHHPRPAQPHTRPLKTGVNCAATDAAGWWSGAPYNPPLQTASSSPIIGLSGWSRLVAGIAKFRP